MLEQVSGVVVIPFEVFRGIAVPRNWAVFQKAIRHGMPDHCGQSLLGGYDERSSISNISGANTLTT